MPLVFSDPQMMHMMEDITYPWHQDTRKSPASHQQIGSAHKHMLCHNMLRAHGMATDDSLQGDTPSNLMQRSCWQTYWGPDHSVLSVPH